MSSIPALRDYYDTPGFPVKTDWSLCINKDPKYSIKMADLKEWLEDANNNRDYICADIVNHVLHIGDILEEFIDDYDKYPTLKPDDEIDQSIIKVVLEGIECFKYAVAQGCPAHYITRKTSDDEEEASFDNIIMLLFIDVPEVRSFVTYYIRLFPEFEDDENAVQDIIADTVFYMNKFENGFNIELFNMIIGELKSMHISLDYVYYDALMCIFANINYNEGDDALRFIQLGIDNGFKLDCDEESDIIEYLFEIEGTIYLDLDNLAANLPFYRALPRELISNYDEWYNQERDDVVISNTVKTNFVIKQRLAQNRDLVNTNLAHVANLVTDYY